MKTRNKLISELKEHGLYKLPGLGVKRLLRQGIKSVNDLKDLIVVHDENQDWDNEETTYIVSFDGENKITVTCCPDQCSNYFLFNLANGADY